MTLIDRSQYQRALSGRLKRLAKISGSEGVCFRYQDAVVYGVRRARSRLCEARNQMRDQPRWLEPFRYFGSFSGSRWLCDIFDRGWHTNLATGSVQIGLSLMIAVAALPDFPPCSFAVLGCVGQRAPIPDPAMRHRSISGLQYREVETIAVFGAGPGFS